MSGGPARAECPACTRPVGITRRGVLYRHNVPVVGRVCWGSGETLDVLRKIRTATDRHTAVVVAEIDAARVNAQPGGLYGRLLARGVAS